jgi:hypothetical protein
MYYWITRYYSGPNSGLNSGGHPPPGGVWGCPWSCPLPFNMG